MSNNLFSHQRWAGISYISLAEIMLIQYELESFPTLEGFLRYTKQFLSMKLTADNGEEQAFMHSFHLGGICGEYVAYDLKQGEDWHCPRVDGLAHSTLSQLSELCSDIEQSLTNLEDEVQFGEGKEFYRESGSKLPLALAAKWLKKDVLAESKGGNKSTPIEAAVGALMEYIFTEHPEFENKNSKLNDELVRRFPNSTGLSPRSLYDVLKEGKKYRENHLNRN